VTSSTAVRAVRLSAPVMAHLRSVWQYRGLIGNFAQRELKSKYKGSLFGWLWSLLNPINHASTPTHAQRYKVEPYVVCADVYSAPTHVGRGGWTWYTGSAGWMYRTAIESILGIQVRGAVLRINPCIPRTWPGFEIHYRYGSSSYRIAVQNPQGVNRGIAQATLDGQTLPGRPCDIGLLDDGLQHQVRISLG